MRIHALLKRVLATATLIFTMMATVQAFEPVTGVWSDTGEGQRRTGYSIEFQNGFMLMSIYSYADDNASTNPTWYNTEGYLTKNDDGSLSGTFPLYTVANNQLPNAQGNVAAGSMSIRFTDRETATITWNNFPGNRLAQTTIKKYWFIGTGTNASAKRYAARGEWMYTLLNQNDRNDSIAFRALFDELSGAASLAGRVLDAGNVPASKVLYDDGVDVSLFRFSDGDIYILEVGGGTEYASGIAALVAPDVEPTAGDYRYYATAVRRAGVDHRNDEPIEKSLAISNEEQQAMKALLDSAMTPELIETLKEKLAQ